MVTPQSQRNEVEQLMLQGVSERSCLQLQRFCSEQRWVGVGIDTTQKISLGKDLRRELPAQLAVQPLVHFPQLIPTLVQLEPARQTTRSPEGTRIASADVPKLLQPLTPHFRLIIADNIQNIGQFYPILGFGTQHLLQQVLRALRNLLTPAGIPSLLYRLQQRSLIPAFEGHRAIQHLIEHCARTVHIHLVIVVIPPQYLWRHVERSAREGPKHLILAELASEPKIRDLDPAILEEYIRWFEVPMHDFELMHGGHALQDLFEYPHGFLLRQFPVQPQILGQVAALAVLQHQVEILLRFLEIQQFHDVVMLQRAQDLHLALEASHLAFCLGEDVPEIQSRGMTLAATGRFWAEQARRTWEKDPWPRTRSVSRQFPIILVYFSYI